MDKLINYTEIELNQTQIIYIEYIFTINTK